MLKKVFIIFLCLLMATVMVACGNGDAADTGGDAATDTYKLVIGHVYATNSLEAIMTDYLAEQIEERTNGRVDVTVYANEILGTEREICEQVVLGTCDITFSEGSMWSTVTGVTELGVYVLPFMYSSVDAANYTVKNLINPNLGRICEENNLTIMPAYTVQSGFRQLFTVSKPIHNMQELAGLKVRVPEVDMYVAIWKNLGANPTTTAFSEAYQAMSQGVVEGCEIDYANFVQMNWQEVAKHCSITNHLAALNTAMMNKNKWESYPADIQDIILECFEDAVDFNHKNRAESDQEYIQTIKDAGVEFIELDDEVLAQMKAACQPIYDEFIALGVGDILDEVAKLK